MAAGRVSAPWRAFESESANRGPSPDSDLTLARNCVIITSDARGCRAIAGDCALERGEGERIGERSGHGRLEPWRDCDSELWDARGCWAIAGDCAREWAPGCCCCVSV